MRQPNRDAACIRGDRIRRMLATQTMEERERHTPRTNASWIFLPRTAVRARVRTARRARTIDGGRDEPQKGVLVRSRLGAPTDSLFLLRWMIDDCRWRRGRARPAD